MAPLSSAMSLKLGRMMEEEVIDVEDESSDDDDDLVQEVENPSHQASKCHTIESTDSASEGDQWDEEEKSGNEIRNKNRRRRRIQAIKSKEYYEKHRAEISQRRAQKYINRKNKDDRDKIPKVREMVTVHRVKETPVIQSVESLAEEEECKIIPHGEKDEDKKDKNGLVIAVSWSRGQSAQCPQCSYSASGSAVAEHVKSVHYKIKDFSCHLCDFSCSMERNLKYHMREKHNNFSKQERKKDENRQEKPRVPRKTIERGKIEQCPKCPYSTKYGNLARHMRSAHKVGRSDGEKSDVTIISDLKDEEARNGEQTKASQTTEDFKCNLCSFPARDKDDLITHANGAHRSSSLEEEPEPPQAPQSEITMVDVKKLKELGEKTEKDGKRQLKPQVPSQTADSSADVRVYNLPSPPPTPPPPSRKATETKLPGGWVKKIVPRMSGASSGRYDAYLYAPNGTRFRQAFIMWSKGI